MNVASRLQHLAQTRPEAIFCTFLAAGSAETITFGDLYSRSRSYACKYVEMGVKPDDLIPIVLQHTPHLFYSYLGAIIAGAIPTYLPFPSPRQRSELYWADHEVLFARIHPRLIVTYEANLAAATVALPTLDVPMLLAADEILSPPDAGEGRLGNDYPGFARLATDTACLQHSSGTTSLKKGVMLSHRMLTEHAAAYNAAIGFSEDDRIASWLPLYHDMGFIGCFMGSLLSGAHLIAIDPFEWVMRPGLLLDAIQRYRATFCWLPNFAFSHIVNGVRQADRWDLSSIRAFINCSEPCKITTFERFLERFAPCGVTAGQLQVCYAMAENVFGVTQTPLPQKVNSISAKAGDFSIGTIKQAKAGDRKIDVVSCGPPIDGVQLAIRNSSGDTLKDGLIGEICVRSPYLFSGYYKLPEKTSEKLRDSWYYTADMGFTLDGELFVTGRKDDMIVVAGRNYYAHEIEALANAVPPLFPGRNVAIGIDDPRTDATVVVLLAECPADCNSEDVGRRVRREILEKLGLAVHAVVTLPAGRLIKTTSGKISRTKNKELYVTGGL